MTRNSGTQETWQWFNHEGDWKGVGAETRKV